MLYTSDHAKDSGLLRTFDELAHTPLATRADLYRIRGGDGANQARLDSLGNRWRPVPHQDYADAVRSEVKGRGMEIQAETYCVSKDGHDVFGFLELNPETVPNGRVDLPGGFRPAIGFRGSNVQRFARKGVCGGRVFICGNGVIAGEFLFSAKSTTGNVANLGEIVRHGIDAWESESERAALALEFLRDTDITEEEADSFLLDAGREGIIPSSQLVRISEAFRGYLDPENRDHEAFRARTRWSLYNAGTEVAKRMAQTSATRLAQGFSRILSRGFTMPSATMSEEARNTLTSEHAATTGLDAIALTN